jgi:hypothetical protein
MPIRTSNNQGKFHYVEDHLRKRQIKYYSKPKLFKFSDWVFLKYNSINSGVATEAIRLTVLF